MAVAGLEGFGRTLRHLQRYRQIVAALARHGFADVLHALGVEQLLQLGVPVPASGGATRPERIRDLLAELGPTFIKAGQFLSTRSDLLSEDYLKALASLQDRVPAFGFEAVSEIVAEELGRRPDEVFSRFEREPLAAASIAQIHRARLRSGEEAVVKIQRPGIRETVSVDLEIIEHMAALAERHLAAWRWRRPTEIVAELGRSLDREMDFAVEAAQLERFARDFEGDATVIVPRVFHELSSARVLTMERLDGVKADDVGRLWAAGIDPREAAKLLTRHFLAQVFEHGFFHADLHPGNVFLRPGPVACYLDYGMMGRLAARPRELLLDVLTGIVLRREDAAACAALQLSIVEAEPDRRRFEADVAELMDQYAYRPLKELRLGPYLRRLFQISAQHRLRLPPELFVLVKGVGTLESLTRILDPEFDVVRQAAPVVRRLELRRRRPRTLARAVFAGGGRLLSLARELPESLMDVLKQARRGRLLLEFEHRGLEPLTASLDRVSNRLAFAVVVGSLVVGSSVLVHSRTPPSWHGIPVIGLGGFVAAALLGAWLLYAVIRHGRM